MTQVMINHNITSFSIKTSEPPSTEFYRRNSNLTFIQTAGQYSCPTSVVPLHRNNKKLRNMAQETITPNDRIFATVTCYGEELLNRAFTGIDSLSDLFNIIRRELSGFIGCVTLKVRNGSQGWSRQQGLRIGPRKNLTSRPTEAIQLSLF